MRWLRDLIRSLRAELCPRCPHPTAPILSGADGSLPEAGRDCASASPPPVLLRESEEELLARREQALLLIEDCERRHGEAEASLRVARAALLGAQRDLQEVDLRLSIGRG